MKLLRILSREICNRIKELYPPGISFVSISQMLFFKEEIFVYLPSARKQEIGVNVKFASFK